MVPPKTPRSTPTRRAWIKVISGRNEKKKTAKYLKHSRPNNMEENPKRQLHQNSDEMQKFINKVKATFRTRKTKTSKTEKRDEDITIDAAILPDSSELRSTGTGPQDECFQVNSPTGRSEESLKHITVSHHKSPAESLTGESSHPIINASQVLHQQWTALDAVNECPRIAEIPEEKQHEIITRINKTVQELPEYFYDFCMVSSDEDYEDAKMLKNELSAKFNLRGCTIYEDDFFSLGADSFEAYESMMDRSTKIFFYISSSLNKDAFCRRLQSASVFQGLMSKIRREKEKCVPVFPHGICRVPLPLSGIGGLEIPSPSLTAQRIRITYTEDVRNQRLSLEQDRRKTNFLKMLKVEVDKFFKEDTNVKFHSEPLDSNDNSDCEETKSDNFTSTSPKGSSNPTSGLFEGVQELLQNTMSAPVVGSSQVTIDSTTAHIGHNITIHVNCHHECREKGSNVSSDLSSSSSDSEVDC